METTQTPNPAVKQPAAAPAPSAKSPEKFVEKTPQEWKSAELKKALPPRFEWRGQKYVTANLTEEQLQKLAEDRGFSHIVKK